MKERNEKKRKKRMCLPCPDRKQAHVRCFSHTVNLTAKGMLRPFKPTKPVNGQPPMSPDDIGLDELYMVLRDIKENGEKGADDVEGFVKVLNEMMEEEREQWKEDIEPVRMALFKVSLTLHCHSALSHHLSIYLPTSVHLPCACF